MPRDVEWIKCDLFDNQKNSNGDVKHNFKLSMNVKRKDKNIQTFRANLNSPARHMKRNLQDYWETAKHYQRFQEEYKDWREQHKVAISKFYSTKPSGKAHAVAEMSVMLILDQIGAGEYGMFLLIGDWECSCLLKGKDLTEKQRNSNQIATAMILHERGAVTKPLTLEEALWNN